MLCLVKFKVLNIGLCCKFVSKQVLIILWTKTLLKFSIRKRKIINSGNIYFLHKLLCYSAARVWCMLFLLEEAKRLDVLHKRRQSSRIRNLGTSHSNKQGLHTRLQTHKGIDSHVRRRTCAVNARTNTARWAQSGNLKINLHISLYSAQVSRYTT